MKSILALLLLCANQCLGAIPAATAWEVRTAGSDSNGGGFDGTGSPSVDYSQNNNKNASGCSNCGSSSVNLSTMDAVITSASTTVTSATASFSSAVTGNIAYFSGGNCTTGSINTQWRRVAYSSATAITLDVAPTGTFTGTCTGVTMNIGGALASPSIAAANKVAGNDVYIKSGTYTVSSTTATTSNGVVLDSTGGTVTNQSVWWGYGTTRGDDGAKPLLQASGISSVSLFKVTGTQVVVRNLSFDGGSLTSIKCLEETGGYFRAYRLKASNCTNRAFDFSTATIGVVVMIEASGCSTTGAILLSGQTAGYVLSAHDNAVTGITLSNASSCAYCFSYRNTGATSDGFATGAGGGGLLTQSVAAYNGRAGINLSGNAGNGMLVSNAISYGNATGLLTDQVQDGIFVFNSATGANTTSNYNSSQLPRRINHTDLTADPFTNVSSSTNGAADFALNTTLGGGAALRAAGFVGPSPGGASTGYQDIGPMQHADPPGGGAQRSFTFLQ